MKQVVATYLRESDIPALARIAFDWLQSTTFHKGTRSIDGVKQLIKESVQDAGNTIFLISYNELDSIDGWLSIYLGFPRIAFIDNWHPYVTPNEHADEIARLLIEKAKEHIVEIGKERLEIEFTNAASHPELLKRCASWYDDASFRWAAEEIGMHTNLESLELEKVPLPTNYLLVPIGELGNEVIRKPFFDSFTQSHDDLFLSMTDKQQIVAFDYWFNRTRPMVDQASYAVLFEDRCVGFTIARVEKDDAYIGPIGVIPSHRGKGIGNSLLSNSLYEMKRQGIQIVTLDVSSSNEPALKLYRTFGFEETKRQIFYYWTAV